jgi:hypothetical protein
MAFCQSKKPKDWLALANNNQTICKQKITQMSDFLIRN